MLKYILAVVVTTISFFFIEYYVFFKNPYEYLNTTAVLLIVNFFIFLSFVIALIFTFVMEKNIDRYRRRVSRTIDNLPTLEEFINTINALHTKGVRRNFSVFVRLLGMKEGQEYIDLTGSKYKLLTFGIQNTKHELMYIGRHNKEIDLLIDEPYPHITMLDVNSNKVEFTLEEFVRNLTLIETKGL